ncbi:COG4648 family protein [Chitinimonas lacunae]|uniref:DNA gyrase subunit B n=1 Tax=Chitinimonas lacunae TaxID=1963018 RepID=A0ABV8MQZ3_9NEIS
MRAAIVTLLTLAYPLLVYLGLGRFEPRWLALLLAGLALLRALATRERVWLAAAAGALLLAGVSALGNAALPLKLYPVLVNGVLLGVFLLSLSHPPSMIERLARLREPDLPPEAVVYTRRVTQVWCGFFVLNGSMALYTALWASDALWALYNGLIAYGLMGVLFLGEWLVRGRVRARTAHG